MDSIDIYRAANILLAEYGPDTAWQRALGRVADLAGDEASQATWLRVLDAVDELTAKVRAKGQGLH